MRDDEIDRALAGEEDVPPSPGFHVSVMAAVHREAATPPPIPFPWKRLWPAFAVAALLGVASPVVAEALVPVATSLGAPWIAVALLATAGSLLLSRRLAEESY